MEVDAILAAADSDSGSDLNMDDHLLKIEDILNETASDGDERIQNAVEFENAKVDVLKSSLQHIDSPFFTSGHESGIEIPSSSLIIDEGLEPIASLDIDMMFSSEELEQIIRGVDLEDTAMGDSDNRADGCTLSSPISLQRHVQDREASTHTPFSLGRVSRALDSSTSICSDHADSAPSSPVSKAEAFELKSFREDQRLMVNPLEVKRRMRASTGQGIPQVRGGAIRMEPLDRVSSLLSRNTIKFSKTSEPGAADDNSQRSRLGSGTCIAVHLKFIIVGTSMGALMLFDHFQELRHILGPCNLPGQTHHFDSVTSIAIFESSKGSATGDFLVSGSASGCIILWDYIKGTVLNVVDDAHSAPIMSIQCLGGDPAVVTCDSKGVLNKISFRRVMWSAWIADVLCLLDGTAGTIQSMSLLVRHLSGRYLKSTGAASVTPNTATTSPPSFTSTMKGLSAKISKNTKRSSTGGSFHDESNKNETTAPSLAKSQSANNAATPNRPPLPAAAVVSSATASRGAMYEHLLAICHKKSTFIIAMEPVVKVIFKWPSPVAAKGKAKSHGQTHVTWMSQIKNKEGAGNGIDKAADATSLLDDDNAHAILIRSCGCSIQSMRFLRGDNNSSVPTLERCHNMTMGDPILAIECINLRIIAYLTEKMNVHICHLDTEMTEFHNFFVGACHLASRQPPPTSSSSSSLQPDYSGSFRACDQLYLLGSDSLTMICLSSWKQRIDTLVSAGEWLEALTVSLDHFQEKVEPYNDPDLAFATALLLRYVKLAVENAPHGGPSSLSKSQQGLDLVTSHFEMLAGVCIEYSAITQKLGCLFSDIYSQFVAASQLNIFLTALGPYIMNGRVKWLPVQVLQSLTQFHEKSMNMKAVEHYIMSLDKMGEREGQELDIGAVLAVLQRCHLWAGLLNVCSIGLNDYLSAFEALLQLLMEKADLAHSEITAHSEASGSSCPENAPFYAVKFPGDHEFQYLGYLLLVYLRRCLQGKGFLFGEIPSGVLPHVRAQLLYLLCQRVSCASGVGNIKLENVHHLNGLGVNNTIWRASTYPYLRILLYFDPEATLRIISSLLDLPGAQFNDDNNITSLSTLDDEHSTYEDQGMLAAVAIDMGITRCPGRRYIIMAVTSVLAPEISGEVKQEEQTTHIVPSCRDGSHWPESCRPSFFDFVSKNLEFSVVRLPGHFVNAVLAYILTERSNEPRAQSQLMTILQHASAHTLDIDALLSLMVEARFFRAAAFLLRSSPLQPSKFKEVLAYYLQDTTHDFRVQIFDLIRNESPHIAAVGGDVLEDIGSILASLVELDVSSCVRLICDMGWSHDWAIEKLGDQSRLKFQYLDVLFRQSKELVQVGSCNLELSEDTGDAAADEGSSSSEALSEQQQSQYIELLIQFEPQSVYTYLSMCGHYDLEKTLDLCRSNGLLDATAYSLEKNGDIGGALDLSISSIDEKVLRLKVILHSLDIEALVMEKKMRRHTSLHTPSTIFSFTSEGRDLSNSVDFVIDLCKSYKRTSGNDSFASLWLAALDKLIGLKSIAIDESHKGVEIIVGVMDALIQRLLDAMSVELPLPYILKALLVCHSERSLGEFRELLISILDSTVYEHTIHRVATSLLFNDVLSLAHHHHDLIRAGVNGRLGGQDRLFLTGDGMKTGSTTCNGRVTIDVVGESHDSFIRRRLALEESRRELSNARMRQTVAKVGMSGCNLTPSLHQESKHSFPHFHRASAVTDGRLSAGISGGGSWSQEARKGIASAIPRFMGNLREKIKQPE